MGYGQWKIDENLTKNEFGYYSNELSPGSKKPVKCICLCCGEISNKRFRESNRKHICKSIINGKKKCFKCKTFKPIDEFSKNRSTFDGYQKVCKECFSNYDSVKVGYKKRNNLRKLDIKTYFRDKTTYLKNKSKLLNVDFDLDENTLYEIFLKQKGKCYYTDIDLNHNNGCHQYDSISIERLNPDDGYIKSNVVISSFCVNSFKGMMNESEFKNFLSIVIPKLIVYKDK